MKPDHKVFNPTIIVVGISLVFIHGTISYAMWTPLHENIYQRNEIRATEEILAHPDMINQLDSSHWSPLHWASATGQATIVMLLIAHNAKIQDFYDDNTPLHLAASEGHDEVVRILLENGASDNQKNSYGQTPLSLACARGHRMIVDRLYTHNKRKHQARLESLIFARITHPRLGEQAPPACHWIVRMICGYLKP